MTIARTLSVVAVLLAAAAACSQNAPGTYEGGGRTNPPDIVGGAGSGCAAIGEACQASGDCCSHLCEFNGIELVCAQADAGTAPTCKPDGQSCTVSTDCCTGVCSTSLTCGAPPPPKDAGGGGG